MSRCRTGAGRAGQARDGGQGRGLRRRLRPLLPGLSRPARRPLASLEQEQAAAAPGRPLGVGVLGWLRPGSSSLHRHPRPRSHHLDLARGPLPLGLLGGCGGAPGHARPGRPRRCRVTIGALGALQCRHHVRRGVANVSKRFHGSRSPPGPSQPRLFGSLAGAQALRGSRALHPQSGRPTPAAWAQGGLPLLPRSGVLCCFIRAH